MNASYFRERGLTYLKLHARVRISRTDPKKGDSAHLMTKRATHCFATCVFVAPCLVKRIVRTSLHYRWELDLLVQNDKDVVSSEFSVADKATKGYEATHNERHNTIQN